MVTEVRFPAMGESIADGQRSRWVKKVGDTVERDEPLYEISTDKIDSEIPSPVSGRIAEIKAAPGRKISVGATLALIEEGDGEKTPPETNGEDRGAKPE